jgi:uncharacterized protein YceH (UPF0502 family)
VEKVAPAPGSRAPRYMQLLAPGAHPKPSAAPQPAAPATPSTTSPSQDTAAPAVQQRIEALETDVAQLKAALRQLAQSLGEDDPLRD